ncbi:hypothetical protein F5B19DRAFT_501782 [Rostrohypoxylon terebratum]|nr:hypothetical protein F5B19DRAFT_501782 [Rostrohypoxylon terebratum]
MDEEPQIPRPDKLPSISSPVDSMSTGSTTNQPLTNAGTEAVLPGRVGSFNISEKLVPAEDEEEDEELNQESNTRRGRTTSPLRADVKRGRSVASAPGDVSGGQPSSTFHLQSDISNGQNSPVALSNGADVQDQLKETIALKKVGQEHPTKRSSSRASATKARKRRNTNGKNKTSDNTDIEKSEIIRNSPDVTQSPKLPIIPPLSLYGDADDGVEDEEPKYERKGAFWLKKDKGPEEFRFPKPLSHPEPLWSPGDGFSVDEARPSLAFGMTGSQKQRKPKPTPGVGELQLETRDEDKGQARGSRISRRNNRRLDQYEMKHRRDVPKDIWPTVDNFSEELKVQKRNPTVLASEKTIPSTMPPQPTPVPQLRETFSYNLPLMPRQRGHEDFENFGRHLSNNNEMSDICVSETQINPADDAAQPEPAGDESFYGTEEEYEIEWEEESDNEHVIFPWHNEEPDGMGECEFSNEEVTFCDTPNSESTLDYIEHAVQELEHIGNLLGVGDVAREEAFDFSS